MRLMQVVFVVAALFVVVGCSDRAKELTTSAPAATLPVAAPPADSARSSLLAVGEAAPDFTARDQQGRDVRLDELLRDNQVVLVFYPADFTPGCTRQLCAVRDDWSKFQQRRATVLGVNPADVEKHASFAEKYEFPFPVLSDSDSRIAAAYGTKGETSTQRAVYVIGRDGKVKLAEAGMVPHDRIFAALE